MPFPLAHPAAILPLRRFTRRWLNFPALIIGSLSPDLAYCSGRLHLENFSHRFLAGSFGFALPVGLLGLWLFYLVRRSAVSRLPPPYRQLFTPLCQAPAGSLLVLAGSVLVGAWTHLLLDSMTHGDGWLVEHLSFLQSRLVLGDYRLATYDALYAAFSFAGVLWIALVYLTWLERVDPKPARTNPGSKWCSALAFAALSLLLSFANRRPHPWLDIIPLGITSVLLVTAFVAWTGRASFGSVRPVQGRSPAASPQPPGQ